MTYSDLGDTRPKARKRHQCFLCGQPIEPGWVYVRNSSVEDGKFISAAMHPACLAQAREWDHAILDCGSRSPDDFEGEWPKYDSEGRVIGGVTCT